MSDASGARVAVTLAFPDAGVSFEIEADSDGPFRLTVSRTSDGAGVPFTSDASPQLADWVRGYTRWLRRARVAASHDESRISGMFDDGLSPEQVLEGVRDACDMVRQRFGRYRESVLV